jgi:tetrahydromethanopterin S-methyltransferase subunit A
MSADSAHQHQALELVREQITESIHAKKCHPCGCLHDTLAALAVTDIGRTELAPLLAEASRVLEPKQYDCLGCPVCYPAVAANALAEAYPDATERLAACPTEPPGERAGWPPLPGDYHVVRYAVPVAVCTLNSDELAGRLAARRPSGLGIVGTLHTENLGIERIIRNVLANPNIRFLVVCGEDTRQAIGHLPGQSLASLFANGTDQCGHPRSTGQAANPAERHGRPGGRLQASGGAGRPDRRAGRGGDPSSDRDVPGAQSWRLHGTSG